MLFFEPPDARHREGKMRMTTQAAVQWPRRTIYHGRLSRSEFHEGQVPLNARGSCSWCWKDSFHIQRLVNIVDLKVAVSYCCMHGAIVVGGEREYAAEVGEGAMMV